MAWRAAVIFREREREKLILNITVFVVRVWRRARERGTVTECYCVCCERLAEGNIERN
jgi:hypothetical protein